MWKFRSKKNGCNFFKVVKYAKKSTRNCKKKKEKVKILLWRKNSSFLNLSEWPTHGLSDCLACVYKQGAVEIILKTDKVL